MRTCGKVMPLPYGEADSRYACFFVCKSLPRTSGSLTAFGMTRQGKPGMAIIGHGIGSSVSGKNKALQSLEQTAGLLKIRFCG